MSYGCSSPLGLTTGDVLDWQISASSSYPATWDAGCQVKYARLHQPNGRALCAGRRAAGEWVLVNLGVPAKVTGLLTQGKGDDEEWVTSFELSYSLDAYHWHFARYIYNNKKADRSGLELSMVSLFRAWPSGTQFSPAFQGLTPPFDAVIVAVADYLTDPII
ncbi:EGF-like repeat and discoidin I-like domain-containing protein 3 [Eriocheir sinensis]|uniref:EGF-like repeat and discoidin I-like domain-containing protein 3 n=1 Tax=Eriocheir sinensis TaxID=95602 RepID=UPI0021C67B23|nr:EGF-like repeat and discoidin I-like domain-containing protein 3 [Eriocheir sinensis]